MRVLWFSVNPSLYNPDVRKGSGNWISSLEKQIMQNTEIELGIAFHKSGNAKLLEEKKNNVSYFILPYKYITKAARLYKNWICSADNEFETEIYFKVIELFKPDVIQIFGFETSFVKILSRYNDMTIIHIQGILNVIDHFYNGNFSGAELSKVTNFSSFVKGNSYNRIRKLDDKKAHNESVAFKQCKYLFGRTEWDRRVSMAVSPQAKYFYCQEIMREEFYFAKWNKPRENEIILYTTMADRARKGIDQVFHLDNILQKYHPALKYKIRIAGLNEKSRSVKAMQNRGFKNTVRLNFLGMLSAMEIIGEMQQADIFIYPSLIENGCNAVQEAMLLGMPIVSAAAGGLSSTITNNETGLLVQPGDPYALAGGIISLVEDYESAKKLGVNARSIALKRHNQKDIAETVILTYKAIIEINRKSEDNSPYSLNINV